MKQVRTVYPTDPCKSFEEWQLFIKCQNVIYEGINLANSDIKKPFTINEHHLKKVNDIKWMRTIWRTIQRDKGKYANVIETFFV